LHAIETGIQAFRLELAELSRTAAVAPPRVHRAWVLGRLAHLEEVLAQDPARAKIEIMKHLDGELTISPRPSMAGERRAEVTGRVTNDDNDLLNGAVGDSWLISVDLLHS